MEETSHPESLDAARANVRSNAAGIIRTLIDHAKKTGSYLHAKFLFEFAGISAADVSYSGSGEGDSLAKLLLRELDEHNPN